MAKFHKLIIMMTVIILCTSLLAAASAETWTVGNTDLNILNGGIMLSDRGDLYFNHNGIFVQRDDIVSALSADDGCNLNLQGNFLYYTLGTDLKKIPKSGGTAETVFSASDVIEQMFVLKDKILFIVGGQAHRLPTGSNTPQRISDLTDISGLIPTQYGNIFITGDPFDYTLWAGEVPILSGVSSCYTDSGHLITVINGKNYMTPLKNVFNGFDAAVDLKAFSLHGTVSLSSLLSPDDENTISEYNDNYELLCDYDALLAQAGLKPEPASFDRARTFSVVTESETITPEISEGQKNIVKRARQLMEIQWTPLENRSQWGNRGIFYAENTYAGIPYGQPVNTNGYIGYGVSLEQFATAVLDNTSRFYTTYSEYNKIAPCYSTDCSGFVSYAWGLPTRKTTYSLVPVAEKVGDQSLYSLQVGDCLNKITSHVVLISDITYDREGKVIGLEVSEQTPVITRKTGYGEGESRSLASFQSYYLESGYEIYRNPNRDSVTYKPSPTVALDGEQVAGMKEAAPKSRTTTFVGGKKVELSANTPGAAVYYTTDGSFPTVNSKRYSGELAFYGTTKLRAIAVSGSYTESTVLEYTVKVPQLSVPTAELVSGISENGMVSSGTKLALVCPNSSTIFYTTDGSEPNTSSAVYSSPIVIIKDTTIKVFAQGKGFGDSKASSETYRVGELHTITASAGAGGSISPSGNVSAIQTGSKIFTIKANKGYAVSDVIVDGLSVGPRSSYSFTDISSSHTISVKYRTDVNMPFVDVEPGTWYYDAIGFVYSNELFKGMSNTVFEPDTEMERGMFVTVLGRFAGLPNKLSGTIGLVDGTGVNIREGPSTDTAVVGFVSNKRTAVNVLGQSGGWYKVSYGTVTGYIRNDLIKVYDGYYKNLPGNAYYSVFFQWAYLSGVGNGVFDSLSYSEVPISRQDMCVLLYNYSKIYGKTLPNSEDRAIFKDDSKIESNAKEAIYALQQADIINGMGNNVFSPQGTATRAQVAQIYKNFVTALS